MHVRMCEILHLFKHPKTKETLKRTSSSMCVGMFRHMDEKLRHRSGLRRVSFCSCRSSRRNTPTLYWTPTVWLDLASEGPSEAPKVTPTLLWTPTSRRCLSVGGFVGRSDGHSDTARYSDVGGSEGPVGVSDASRRVHQRFGPNGRTGCRNIPTHCQNTPICL